MLLTDPINPAPRPVGVFESDFDGLGFVRGFQNGFDRVGISFPVVRMDELVSSVPDQFLGIVAEDSCDGGAHVRYRSLCVDDRGYIVRLFDQRPMQSVCFSF
jgi:hypothetical protein